MHTAQRPHKRSPGIHCRCGGCASTIDAAREFRCAHADLTSSLGVLPDCSVVCGGQRRTCRRGAAAACRCAASRGLPRIKAAGRSHPAGARRAPRARHHRSRLVQARYKHSTRRHLWATGHFCSASSHRRRQTQKKDSQTRSGRCSTPPTRTRCARLAKPASLSKNSARRPTCACASAKLSGRATANSEIAPLVMARHGNDD